MNKRISCILTTVLVFAVALTSCKKDEKSKMVMVVAQGMLTAGEAETITFDVITENIVNGDYDVQVASLPTGVTVQGRVTISGGKGTLTLAGSATTTATVYKDLTLTIDNTTSRAFTLTIMEATFYINASPTTLVFESLEMPYSQPAAKTVTITNTGTGSVTLTQPTATNYEIGTLTAATLAAGEKSTFTVRPKAGLAEGQTGITRLNETLTISGTDDSSATVTVIFDVWMPTYIIDAGPQALHFGSLTFGYAQPAAQTVAIHNYGSGAITLNPLPTVDNYTLTALSGTNLTGFGIAAATFTVRPDAGLAVGTYNREITITGTVGATVTISTSFTVTENTDE